MNNWQHIPDYFNKLMSNLPDNEDLVGGALVVHHKGQCVVNTAIGHSNSDTLWTTDTLSLNFSTGKGVLATLVHVLVSNGLLEYDTAISHYWHEFASNGKASITLRHVMSHQANLFAIDSIIDDGEQMLDWQAMLEKVATMPLSIIKPKENCEYGTAYSALVYGWILGGLISKVTDMSLQQALNHYLAKPLAIEGQVYFSLPTDKLENVAQPQRRFDHVLTNETEPNKSRRKPTIKPDSPQTLAMYQELPCYQQWQTLHEQRTGKPQAILTTADINRFYFNPNLLNLANYRSALMSNSKQDFDYYLPHIMQASLPAVNCIASANALAKIYSMLAHGGTIDKQQIIDSQTFAGMQQVQNQGGDAVMPASNPSSMLWRLGYHRLFSVNHGTGQGFGHNGYNGSMAWCDNSRQLAVAFVHNIDTILLNDIRGLTINEIILATHQC